MVESVYCKNALFKVMLNGKMTIAAFDSKLSGSNITYDVLNDNNIKILVKYNTGTMTHSVMRVEDIFGYVHTFTTDVVDLSIAGIISIIKRIIKANVIYRIIYPLYMSRLEDSFNNETTILKSRNIAYNAEQLRTKIKIFWVIEISRHVQNYLRTGVEDNIEYFESEKKPKATKPAIVNDFNPIDSAMESNTNTNAKNTVNFIKENRSKMMAKAANDASKLIDTGFSDSKINKLPTAPPIPDEYISNKPSTQVQETIETGDTMPMDLEMLANDIGYD